MALFLAFFLLFQQGITVYAENAVTESETTDTSVSAKVETEVAEYYVTFPSTISLGEISENKDISISYEIEITMNHTNGGTLRVSTSSTGYFYLNGDTESDALKYTNSFKTRDFTESTVVTATLYVSAEDVAKVAKGSYTGFLLITSTYYEAGETLPEIEEEEEVTTSDSLVGVEKTVHFKKSTDIGVDSMSDPLFYDSAYLTDNGDGTTTVSIYAIDPVPGYADYGKPVETFIACGSDEDVTVTGSGTEDYELAEDGDSFADVATIVEKAASLYYDAAGVFIPTAGYYDSDEITFTVDNNAIRNSKNGALFVEVFVGTVMQSWQKLYIVFDDVDDWSTGTSSFAAEALPGTTVSGLDTFAEEHPEYGNVEMVMGEVGTDTEAKLEKAAIEELLEDLDYGRSTTYYTFDLYDEAGESITETDSVIEIAIPWSLEEGKTLSVFRSHGTDRSVQQFSALTKRAGTNGKDGTFYYDSDAGKVYIYTNKFSVYAIHEETTSTSSSTSTGGSTSSTTTTTTTTDTSSTTSSMDGTYLVPVSMRKYTDFNANSMCDTLFYDYATMTISGTSATITVYVIDPIPNYQSYGTPISNVKVKYGATTVSAVLDSSAQKGLYFAADGSFIPTSGYYNADPVTFTVPYAYVAGSSGKTMLMQAYVNAVMASTESFYMVFDTDNMTKDATLTTSTETVDLTTIEEATADDEDDENSDSTSTTSSNGTLADGTYQVKVGAKKSNSDDDSMMATYMYPTGELVVSGSTSKLTIYVQHTVAGKENGGPKYIKYQGVEAVKVSSAKTFDGVVYDSFTITAANPIPSILPITMYVNAMGMEVGCRLTVDTSSTGGTITTSSTSVSDGSGDTDATSGDALAEEDTPLISGLTTVDENGNVHFTAKSVFVIVLLVVVLLGVLGVAGYYLYLRYKKRNMMFYE